MAEKEHENGEELHLEEIKQLVFCINCHDEPNTKLLACYHALCGKCISIFQQKNSINCPVCLKATPVPEKGVSMLDHNSLGEDLYQITKCEADFKLNTVACTNCIMTPANIAEHFCQQCKKYFCQADFQTHQLQSDESEHCIISRGDMLSISYCEDRHGAIKQSIQEMQSRAKVLSQLMQEFEFQKRNVEREEQKLKSEIRDRFQELREKINRREKYLSEILNNHYDLRRKELEKSSEEVAAILLKLYHNINFASKTVEMSPGDILARINGKLLTHIRSTLDSVSTEDILVPEAEPLVFKVDSDVMDELVNFGSIGINRNYFTIDQPTMLFAKQGKQKAAGLAVDDENSILVVNQESKCIDVFSTEGGYIKSWGNEGKADGNFQNPHAICCKSNRVLVTDLVKCNVQVFSLSGKFISKFGSKDALKCPIGLDMWKDGYVFVVDQIKRWVVVYTPEFQFGWLLGEGKLYKPVDLKVAQWAEVFFVLDAGFNGVLAFNRDGEVIRKFENDNFKVKEPYSLALDTIGHILVSDLQEKELRVFNWAGRSSEGVCPSFGTPKGIAVDRKGRVVMAEDHDDKLQILVF